MPAYKDEKTGSWYAKFYYEGFLGERKTKFKRGFETKKDTISKYDGIIDFLEEDGYFVVHIMIPCMEGMR